MDKSLDEIIADRRYDNPRRGGHRNNRQGYRRDQSDSRPYTRDDNPGRGGPRDGFRRNDRSRVTKHSSRPYHRHSANLSNMVKITNLHYELTEDDIYELLLKVGPVRRVRIDYDRSGRSEGVALANFENARDAEEAVRRFNGKKAAGLEIGVVIMDESNTLRRRISTQQPREKLEHGLNRLKPYNSNKETEPRKNKIQKKTMEELDAELTSYMNGEDTSTANEESTVTSNSRNDIEPSNNAATNISDEPASGSNFASGDSEMVID